MSPAMLNKYVIFEKIFIAGASRSVSRQIGDAIYYKKQVEILKEKLILVWLCEEVGTGKIFFI